MGGAVGSIREQGATELLAVGRLVDGQAPDSCHRNGGIGMQFIRQHLGQVGERHAAGCQGAVAGDLAAADLNSDIAGAAAAPNVLGVLAGQVEVGRRDAAREPVSAVTGAQSLAVEQRRHFAFAIRRLRALTALRIAGASAGRRRSAMRCGLPTDQRMVCAHSKVRCAPFSSAAQPCNLELRGTDASKKSIWSATMRRPRRIMSSCRLGT